MCLGEDNAKNRGLNSLRYVSLPEWECPIHPPPPDPIPWALTYYFSPTYLRQFCVPFYISGCVNGIYYPPWCLSNSPEPQDIPNTDPKMKTTAMACAAMLADYPGKRNLLNHI